MVQIKRSNKPFPKQEGWHILTVAEAGFSMLTVYADHQYKVNANIEAFADRVNNTNESGSLFPKVPISAIPRKFFRDYRNSMEADILNEFRSHIKDEIKY